MKLGVGSYAKGPKSSNVNSVNSKDVKINHQTILTTTILNWNEKSFFINFKSNTGHFDKFCRERMNYCFPHRLVYGSD